MRARQTETRNEGRPRRALKCEKPGRPGFVIALFQPYDLGGQVVHRGSSSIRSARRRNAGASPSLPVRHPRAKFRSEVAGES